MLSLASLGMAIAVTLTPAPQTDDFNVRVGQEVWIGRTGGRTIHGRVEALTPDEVTITNAQRTTIPASDIIQIRVRDGLWEGTLTGAAIGITAGFFAPGRCDDGECIAGPIVLYGAIGAGIGALLDSISSRKLVYPKPRSRRRAVTVAPIVGRERAGMTFQLRWHGR